MVKSQDFWQLLKTKINKSNSVNQLMAVTTKLRKCIAHQKAGTLNP